MEIEKINFEIPDLYIRKTVIFTKEEMDIIGIMLYSIDKNQLEKEKQLNIELFKDKLNLKDEEVIKLLKAIADKKIEVEKRDEREQFFLSLFIYIGYNAEKQLIKFKFNEFTEGFYLKVKYIYDKNATDQFLLLKGKYSWQVYSMLKTCLYDKKYYASLEYLKNLFNIKDQYKLYADLKRKVLLVTQKEINEKTDIEFQFEEVKNQKKIIGLNFIIKKKS